MTHPFRRRALAVGAGLALTCSLGACAKSETSGSSGSSGSGSGNSAAAAQQVAGEKGGSCTAKTYGAKTKSFKGAKIGFSQSEKEANPFRIAETQSMKDEAKKRGLTVETTNANSQLPKQIADIKTLLAKGVDVLIVAPLNSAGLEPAFDAAAAKGVPVVTVDRELDAGFCKNWVTFIGSDFNKQGHRAAQAMDKATGGKGKVAILLGSSGNNVTTQRTKGFVDEIKASAPGLKVVAQQTGDFARDKGQSVTEQLLQANPDIDAIYAENDEMALGAVTAISGMGKKPGKDVKIVSVDGTRNAVQAIVDGKLNAVIESNPRFGPLAFATAEKFLSGKAVRENIIIKDRQYDSSNAKAEVGSAY
jgi:ABC-type sugar transport system substrate-binding protein